MRNMLKDRRTRSLNMALLVALAWDLLGEPAVRWHPVVWYGKLIRLLEHYAPRAHHLQLLFGAAMLAISAPLACLPALLIHQVAKQVRAIFLQSAKPVWGDLLYALIEGSALKPFFALRMLADAGRA